MKCKAKLVTETQHSSLPFCIWTPSAYIIQALFLEESGEAADSHFLGKQESLITCRHIISTPGFEKLEIDQWGMEM